MFLFCLSEFLRLNQSVSFVFLQFLNNNRTGKILSLDVDSMSENEVKLFMIKQQEDGNGRVITSQTLKLNVKPGDKSEDKSRNTRAVAEPSASEQDYNILAKVGGRNTVLNTHLPRTTHLSVNINV